MELKEFIKESLSQIIDAVKETQEKYKDTNVLVCPDDVQGKDNNLYIDNILNHLKNIHLNIL